MGINSRTTTVHFKDVISTIVDMETKIKGAPPTSLLISYWQFNDAGLVNYCKEVEYS